MFSGYMFSDISCTHCILYWFTRALHLCFSTSVLVMMVSVTSLATISFDRMIGVIWPFHTHLKIWQSVTIIVVIWIVSTILAVPFAIYRIYTVGLLSGAPVWRKLQGMNGTCKSGKEFLLMVSGKSEMRVVAGTPLAGPD